MGRAGREFRDLESLLAREGYHERPLAVLDLDAFDANAADLARRAAGTRCGSPRNPCGSGACSSGC